MSPPSHLSSHPTSLPCHKAPGLSSLHHTANSHWLSFTYGKDQPWVLMLKLKLQYFGHLMRRVDSLEKTLMLGGIGGQEEKVMTEDEMAGWHYQLDGREFEWTLGVGDGQGGLACWDSWGRKESDTTEQLNWAELNVYVSVLLSIRPSLSFPHCVHKSVLYVCVSIAVLQTISSLPSF